MNKLAQFHIDNNYYVKIKPLVIGPDVVSLVKMPGCLVNFPVNMILSKPELCITYIIDENNGYIEVYTLEPNKDIVSKKVKTHKICMRLLILEDVLLKTISRNISRNLILIDGGKHTNIFELLDINLNEDELVLEKELCLSFRNLLEGKVKYDVTNDLIAESFKSVVECFENGGL